MNNSGNSPSTDDHLRAALEASDCALIGLELILAALAPEKADDRAGVRRQTRLAMESLRRAISELRLARGESAAALPFGFVLKAGCKSS
jgi:hypothetical protein